MSQLYVSRSRLLHKFQSGASLVYLSGLAGSGKTALLREWQHLQTETTAWITCNDLDNDPVCFWHRLTSALGCKELVTGLSTDIFPTPLNAAILSLAEWIHAQPGTIHLFVDDFHRIRFAESRSLLNSLLQLCPAGLRVYLASRYKNEAFPLAHWIMTKQAVEITNADLAFTPDEIEDLLMAREIDYRKEKIQALCEYTSGWIAGIALLLDANRWLKLSSAPVSQEVNHLCEEIFGELPDQTRRFLGAASILEVLTAESCYAVTRFSESRELLNGLLAQGFLVHFENIPEKFQISPLWKDFIQHKALDHSTIHQRAVVWYEAQADIPRAIAHAFQADVQLAADLLRRHGRSYIGKGELVTLRGWLEQLPEALVQAYSELSLIYAWSLVHSGFLDKAERFIHHPAQAPEEVFTLRARTAALRRDKSAQIAFSEKALAHIPETNFALHAETLLNLGCAWLELGNIGAARPVLEQALQLSRTAQNARAEVFAHYFLGKVGLSQGRLQHAFQQFRVGLITHPTLSVSGVLHVGIAEVLYEQGNVVEAKQHLDQALRMGQQGGEIKPVAYANIALGALLSPQEAIERLETLASLTNWSLLDAWQTLWWLRAGNTAMPSYWLTELCASDLPVIEFERMVQARVQIALKHWSDARNTLDGLYTSATENQRQGDLLKILLLKMRLHWEQNEPSQAIDCLRRALKIGEAENYQRTFLDEDIFYQVGIKLVASQPDQPHLQNLLNQARPKEQMPGALPFGESVSRREMEVLACIAEGLNNDEIARKLFLTVGTVKWHVHNVFGKLDVKNRTQAVLRAKDLALLSP